MLATVGESRTLPFTVQFPVVGARSREASTSKVCTFLAFFSTTSTEHLAGHIRSHNEEKPFVCKWPGCGKGFARQHDCKRHEQLHTNYRPFVCDGCQKPFARMDALNRHRTSNCVSSSALADDCSSVRSDGGVECQRQLEKNGTLPDLSESPPPRRKSRNAPNTSLPVPLTASSSMGGMDVSMPGPGETVDWGSVDMSGGVAL